MSTDPGGARLERGEVIGVDRLGDLVEVTARLPQLSRSAAPGQFAQLRCSETIVPLLRRPFSVAWAGAETCAFVFDEVGTGTRLLGALQPGDPLETLAPLGRGFSVDAAREPVVCVAGGVGCAPFPLVIDRLVARGVTDITVLNGAATASSLYPAERFRRGHETVNVVEATEDGSAGHRGRVTDLLPHAPAGATLFACGPNVMLAALAAHLRDEAAVGQTTWEASLEAPMGCGFGTCLGCALPVRAPDGDAAWSLCCTDGPVMAMRDVDWEALVRLPGADVA